MGSVSQDSCPRKSILREPRKLGSKHAVRFSKCTRGTNLKFGNEIVHREELSKSVPAEHHVIWRNIFTIRNRFSSILRESPRNPTVVLTANGKVHTHEEAQVFVHDPNPFVTVQLLEEKNAVLSLGKLCEDHEYSYEWVSGQKLRLTKGKKTIFRKTDNFVPLVVPG